MAELKAMPKTRRRRIVMSFGWLITMLGVVFITAAVKDGLFLHPITIVAVRMSGSGLLMSRWASTTYGRAAEADHESLVSSGGADFMPAGASLQGERIGLRTMIVWTRLIFFFGVVMLLMGGLIAAVSDGETEMLIGGLGVVALGVMMFAIWGLVRGTIYWLDADGISRPRFPSSSVRWDDIEALDELQTSVILRTDRRVHARDKRRKNFTIATGALEISQPDLVQLIQSVRRHVSSAPPQ